VVEERIDSEAVKPIGSETWHLADLAGADGNHTTLCGLVVYYGSRRLRWLETPADRRCAFCLGHLRSTASPES
jgi:hypothetical protein